MTLLKSMTSLFNQFSSSNETSISLSGSSLTIQSNIYSTIDNGLNQISAKLPGNNDPVSRKLGPSFKQFFN
ncbi:hypothetical protein CYY_007759 [Polysphondylium violaceum]|uniref:Uncharacterized protein n=1 Tax=Polysphondylium violaceum TaxID=133409 RepID=A0A8J4PN16_9MYCE|nr:hypothetical protein CYY_007759 [Polysphondylium violaceum]